MAGTDPMLMKGVAAHRTGDFDAARDIYQRVLKRRPKDPDALNFLGMLECQQGNHEQGVKLLRWSLQNAPSNPHAWVNLGNVLAQVRELDEACAAYERATGLDPTLWQPWYNLGVLNRHRGRLEDALTCMKQALARNPNHDLAYERLGNLLTRAGRGDEAAQLYREWYEFNPKSAVARHMYAATTGELVPGRAADDYVVELFDGFADSFDQVLEGLGYRAPRLVAAAIERHGAAGAPRDILDAGCGTGLCGPLLKPWSRQLTGVDISGGMVRKARLRGIYDELVVRELCDFMSRRPGDFDVVVSADTLVYFGDLAPAAAGAHRCLRPGGLLAFTVEHWETDDVEATYRLENHGRYSHAGRYVRQVLTDAGFEVLDIGSDVLRKELNQDVGGLVVVARKP